MFTEKSAKRFLKPTKEKIIVWSIIVISCFLPLKSNHSLNFFNVIELILGYKIGILGIAVFILVAYLVSCAVAKKVISWKGIN